MDEPTWPLRYLQTLDVWLDHSPLVLKVLGAKDSLSGDYSTKIFVYPRLNGHLTLSRAGEGKGGKEEEWRPNSVTPLLVQAGSLAATSHMTIMDYGNSLYLFTRLTSSPIYSRKPPFLSQAEDGYFIYHTHSEIALCQVEQPVRFAFPNLGLVAVAA